MRVRDDDVLLIGRGFNHESAVERFKVIHGIIVNAGFVHVAALLCSSLHEFPGALEFLQEQHQNGSLIPEIHGWEHIDYATLTTDAARADLNRCIALIQAGFGYTPTKWYTPWGANAPHLVEAAKNVGLELVDTSRTLEKPRLFTGKMRNAYSRAVLSGEQEFMIHWWADRWIENDTLANTLESIKNHGR